MKHFRFFNDGTQTRAFSNIDDVAPIIAGSINFPDAYNQIFNVGADEPYTINELVSVISDAIGVELNVKYLDARNEVLNLIPLKVKRRKCLEACLKISPSIPELCEWQNG